MARYPKIEIEQAKCTLPFDCKKCLRTCPQAVFSVTNVKMVRLRETDKTEPGAYRLSAVYKDKCTGCNKCVDVCPTGALKITA